MAGDRSDCVGSIALFRVCFGQLEVVFSNLDLPALESVLKEGALSVIAYLHQCKRRLCGAV